MKRPLFLVGGFYLLAMAVALVLGTPTAAALAALTGLIALLCCALSTDRFYRTLAACLLAAGLGLAWSALFYHWRVEPLSRLDGEIRTVSGTVLEKSSAGAYDRYLLRAKVFGVGGRTLQMELCASGERDVKPGDSIICTVRLSAKALDPMYGKSSLAKGIYLSGWINGEIQKSPTDFHPFYAGVARYRYGLREGVERELPTREAGFLCALLLGLRDNLDGALKSQMSQVGLSHIIAVSGLHLAIFTQLLRRLLQAVGMRGRRGALLTILGVWAVAALTGLGQSVLRAAVMLTVYLAGGLMGRKSDSLNSLGFSAIVLGTGNPLAIGGLSMQLTFLSTLGILLFGRGLETGLTSLVRRGEGKPSRFTRGILAILSMTLAAQALTLPLVYGTFGYLPVASLFTSVLVLPLLPFVLGLGMLLALSSCLSLGWAANLLFIPVYGLLRFIETVAKVFAALPLTLSINDRYLYLWIAAAAGVLFWFWRRPTTLLVRKTAALLGVVTLLFGALVCHILDRDTLRLLSMRGCSTTLLIRGSRAVVLGLDEDTRMVEKELERYGVRSIDLLVLTDVGFTSTGDLARLLQSYPTAYLSAPSDPLSQAYLDAGYFGQRLPGGQLSFFALGGVQGRVEPGERITLKIGGTTVLKSLDIYGIMGETSDLLLTSDGGVTLINSPENCRIFGLGGDRVVLKLSTRGETGKD